MNPGRQPNFHTNPAGTEGLPQQNATEATQAPATAQEQTPRNRFEHITSRAEIDRIIKEEELKLQRSEVVPSHEEIFRVYEHAKKSDRENVEESLLRKAFLDPFRDKSKDRPNEDQMREQLHLGVAKVLDEGQEIDFEAARKERGPQIYIRQVYEYEDKRNWLEKGQDWIKGWKARNKGAVYKPDPSKFTRNPTGEVVVTISMNNGVGEEDNTVLSGVFRYENNRLIVDENCLMTLGSEKDFKSQMERTNQRQMGPDGKIRRKVSVYKDTSLNAQLARGELTVSEYKSQFEEQEHLTVGQHWERRDQSLARDLRAAESDMYKTELLDRLTTNYNESLQQAQERRTEIIAETTRKTQETRKRNEDIMNSSDFAWLVEKVKGNGDPKDIERIRKHLVSYVGRVVRDENIDPEQLLNDLLARKGVTI